MESDNSASPSLKTTEVPIHAGGAVLWRAGLDSQPEIAVVHRPRYDDWSLPKGKLDRGETSAHAAVREVREETGFACTLSRWIQQVSYPVPSRRGGHNTKLVDYFAAEAGMGCFHPNDEVDELRWMTLRKARGQLSYEHDRRVLDDFAGVPADAVTVLLVRHAQAGKRSEWRGDDHQRPLSELGHVQRRALHTLLPLFGPRRVHSAPRLRCEQTVSPIAKDLGVVINGEPSLSEEGYWPNPEAGIERISRIAAEGPAVVCSQGGVIPDLVRRLATAHGVSVGEVRSKKGSVWTLMFSHTRQAADGDGSSRLLAADYLADPLPQ